MKINATLIFFLLSINAFAQLEQQVNSNSGLSNVPISEIDSIYFDSSGNEMRILLTDGSIETHALSQVVDVIFGARFHSCGESNVHNPNLIYGSMVDQDGNTYKTIMIGQQEWMAENLYTTHYRNGDNIPLLSSGTAWETTESGAWSYPMNDYANLCPYGRLYNGYTCTDERQLCPSGWHVPNDYDWNVLIESIAQYLGIGNVYFYGGGTLRSTGDLGSQTGFWFSPNEGATDTFGFSALPAGARDWFDGTYYYPTTFSCGFWSSSFHGPYYTNKLSLDYYTQNLSFGTANKHLGYSVRCLKDAPGCADTLACNYYPFATEDDGSCYYPGGECDDLNDTTINDVWTLDCVCLGQIPELGLPHTCGAQFVHNPSLEYGSMTDQEGREYKTILIGQQQWMAENLNTASYRNGDLISTGLSYADWGNFSQGLWAYYGNDSLNACPYGKLYNWYACTDERQLCPQDWHIPNEEDWSELINYLDPTADGGGNFDNVAGVDLKSVGSINFGNGVWSGNNFGATNNTGFSGLPGGYRNVMGDYQMPSDGWWWSATPYDTDFALTRLLTSDTSVFQTTQYKTAGLSVRCVHD